MKSGERERENADVRLSISLIAGLLCAGAALAAQRTSSQAIPNFSPDDSASWFPDREAGDDYLPPASGPGPVLSDPAHPYVPNDGGRNTGRQPTYRVADLTNPILQPWTLPANEKSHDEVLAGKVPFMARERCWPAGVPGLTSSGASRRFSAPDAQGSRDDLAERPAGAPRLFERAAFGQGQAVVVRRIHRALRRRRACRRHDRAERQDLCRQLPHAAHRALHVVERFKLIEDGKTLQILIEVDDPGAFTMKWRAVQRFNAVQGRPHEHQLLRREQFRLFQLRGVADPASRQGGFLIGFAKLGGRIRAKGDSLISLSLNLNVYFPVGEKQTWP